MHATEFLSSRLCFWLELRERPRERQGLSVPECLTAMLPTLRNRDWRDALSRLLAVRAGGTRSHQSKQRRHVQEWFRLLAFSDLFSLEKHGLGPELRLSERASADTAELRLLCDYHEDPVTFWMPDLSLGTVEMGLSWFAHYGSPADIEGQWMVPAEELAEQYVRRNYPQGTDDLWASEEFEANWERNLVLREIVEKGKTPGERGPLSFDEAALIEAQEKREKQGLLHDRIVGLIAKRLKGRGYSVLEAPNSVDILCNKGEPESIIEVKTVNSRSIRSRLRLGMGQLSEYRYRRHEETGQRPRGVLVLSSRAAFPDWMVDYFQRDANLGLISVVSSDSFQAYTEGEIEGVLTS